MPGGFRRKRARGERRVRVDGNGLRSTLCGDAGLADDEIGTRLARLDERASVLERQKRAGFAGLPGAKGEARRALQLADEVRKSVTDLVVIGSGDLALGIRAVATALAPQPGPEHDADAPRLHVVDRLDPSGFAALLATLDLGKTLFNVVAGSDDALATLGHFLIVRERLLQELGAVAYRQHVVVTTRAGESALRQIVHDEGFRSLALPDDVDDAAALLSPAALFPLACSGVDVGELSAAAVAMLERCRAAAGVRPAHLVALALEHAAPAGIRVPAPAAPALRPLAVWIERRLGVPVAATTAARRPCRIACMIDTERPAEDLTIPKTYQDIESVAYLGGQALGALAAHERAAEEITRWTAEEPTLALTLPAVGADAVGQVIALIDAAVLLASASADPTTDREGQRFVYGLAGRSGYEAERAAVQRVAARKEDRYVA